MTKKALTQKFFQSVINQHSELKNNEDFIYKVKHSSRVAKLAQDIAAKEGLELGLSYIIGLLHDIGRFEQTKRGLTFNDDVKLDHGDFGAMVLENSGFIKQTFSKEEAFIIIKAVKNHNKYGIEEGLDDKTMAYCNMIKDADKVDILEYWCCNQNYDKDELSLKVLEEYNNQELICRDFVKTSQDELVNDLSFRFDINYESSKKLAKPFLKILEKKCIHMDKLKKF